MRPKKRPKDKRPSQVEKKNTRRQRATRCVENLSLSLSHLPTHIHTQTHHSPEVYYNSKRDAGSSKVSTEFCGRPGAAYLHIRQRGQTMQHANAWKYFVFFSFSWICQFSLHLPIRNISNSCFTTSGLHHISLDSQLPIFIFYIRPSLLDF